MDEKSIKGEDTCDPSMLEKETPQLLMPYLDVSSCLSPAVHNLLCNVGISHEVHDVLTESSILDWNKLQSKLDLLGSKDNLVLSEYYADAVQAIAPCAENIYSVYHKFSVEEFSSSFHPHLLWTQNEKVFLHSFKLLQDTSHQSSALLAGLLLTASIEKALGDYYLLKSTTLPHLTKDLIASPEVEQTFGKPAIEVLQVLMGPPQSLNLRNIMWHGFVSPIEMNPRYGYLLLAITIGLSVKLLEQNINYEEMIPQKLDDFGSSQVLCTVFPDIGSQEAVEIKEVFENSPLILPIMKEHWQYCLEKYLECRFCDCVTLLLPQLEHVLRVLFCSVNKCPERVLTAETNSHYSSLSVIFSEFVEDKKNLMRSCLGDGIMEILFDLFLLPEGPRVRDRISHGKVDFFKIPQNLASHLLSVTIVICLKVAAEPTNSSYLIQLVQAAEGYHSVFHPFAVLKSQLHKFIESLQAWRLCPVINPEEIDIKFAETKYFLETETVQNCAVLIGETYKIEHLIFRLDLYSEGLENIVESLESFWVPVVYQPKSELKLLSTLRHISDHSVKSSENIQESLHHFFEAWKHDALRDRKKYTYARLLQSPGPLNYDHHLIACWTTSDLDNNLNSSSKFTLYSSICIVLILLTGHILLTNKFSKWNDKEILVSQKFLKKVLTYVENMEVYTDPNKNRWLESAKMSVEFLSTVKDHCHTLKEVKF